MYEIACVSISTWWMPLDNDGYYEFKCPAALVKTALKTLWILYLCIDHVTIICDVFLQCERLWYEYMYKCVWRHYIELCVSKSIKDSLEKASTAFEKIRSVWVQAGTRLLLQYTQQWLQSTVGTRLLLQYTHQGFQSTPATPILWISLMTSLCMRDVTFFYLFER